MHRDEASLMLVGHNPQFDQLAPYLLGTPHLAVDFKRAPSCESILRVSARGQRGRSRRRYLTAKLSSSRE